jgi:serine protease Do
MIKRGVWLLSLAALLCCGCLYVYHEPPDQMPEAQARPTGLPGHGEAIWADAPARRGGALAVDSETFVRLAEKANPAVVNIFSTKRVRTAVGLGLFAIRTPNLDLNAQALGTGFFISADGFVVTNAHVVAGADEIKIFYWRENQVKTARLIGFDATSDLALLKVEEVQATPYLLLADSDAVRVGEMVVAIGNPFGLDHSLTNGLISAKHRRLHEGGQGLYEDFLQTSAQINPGNSGGPLLDLNGAVVGVNTAIVEGGQAIGFAVPSNLLREVLPHLVRTGGVRPAYVGAKVSDPAPDFAAGQGVNGGALVTGVSSPSPALDAGLRAGDVLLEINGRPVYDAPAATRTLRLLIVGRPAQLTVLRERRRVHLSLVPADAASATLQRGQTPD